MVLIETVVCSLTVIFIFNECRSVCYCCKVNSVQKEPANIGHQHHWQNSRLGFCTQVADWIIFKVFSHPTYPQLSSWDYFVSCATSCLYCLFLPLKSAGPRGDHKGGTKSSEGTSAASLQGGLQADLNGVFFICRANNSCFHCRLPLTAAATASGIYCVFSLSSQIKEKCEAECSVFFGFYFPLGSDLRTLGNSSLHQTLHAWLWNSSK